MHCLRDLVHILWIKIQFFVLFAAQGDGQHVISESKRLGSLANILKICERESMLHTWTCRYAVILLGYIFKITIGSVHTACYIVVYRCSNIAVNSGYPLRFICSILWSVDSGLEAVRLSLSCYFNMFSVVKSVGYLGNITEKCVAPVLGSWTQVELNSLNDLNPCFILLILIPVFLPV